MAGNGLTSVLICVMLLVGMPFLSFFSTAQQASLPYAEAQGLELVERGRDFELYWNGSTEQHTMVIGVPTWVLDGSEGEGGYRSYTFRELGNNVVEVKTGLVSGVVYEDHMELYDPDLTELRAVERLDLHIGGKVTLAFTSQVVSHDTNGIDITNHYNLDQDTVTICTISITYSFQAGKPLSRLISDNDSCPKGLSKVLDTVWHMPTTIDEVDTAKSNATKSSESNDKLSSKPITKTNNNDIDSILMKKNDTMWIREATMPNKDVLDSIKMNNNSVRFSYDLGQDGIDFRHADTYTSDNPTVDGDVTDNDSDSGCNAGDEKITSNTSLRVSRGNYIVACTRAFVQWDITSIPDRADVTNVQFGFQITGPNNSSGCDFKEMDTEPDQASAATIFTDIGDGTTFINSDTTCDTQGSNKLVDLGVAADADVEAQLSADWWAVGIKQDNESTIANMYTYFRSEEYTTATPRPTLTVTYTVPPNNPPVADAGDSRIVNEGNRITLDGRGSSDPDGDSLTYSWTQASGITVTLSNPTAVRPKFFAPEVPSLRTMVFVLVVNDGTVDSSPDSVTIYVINTNDPPVADAGPDQTVDEGTSVTLDGGDSSDPDNDSITYSWVQSSGTTVTLSSYSTTNPVFTAPSVSTQAVLVFALTVNDGTVNSQADSVTIYVNNVVVIPTTVIQPIRLTLANTGSGITYSVTTCSASPSTISGDGITHNISVDAGCSITLTSSISSTTRYVFDNGSISRSFTSCSSGTCSLQSHDYWYQRNSEFDITIVYGGFMQPLLSYTKTGTALSQLLSIGTNSIWADNGTPWTVRNPEVSGDERFMSQDYTSGIIPSINDMTFVHQFNKGLAYSLPLGGTLPGVPTITLSQNQASISHPLTLTVTDTWTDATGYTTSTINNGNERFMPPGGGVITDATGLTIPYYLQYRFTIGFTIHAGGMPLNAADRIYTTYENMTNIVIVTFDSPRSQQIWADNSNIMTLPRLTTTSNAAERHVTPGATTVTPSPGGSHIQVYFNQLALDLRTTGTPVPKPRITFTGNATTVDAPLGETRSTLWADRGSTYTIERTVTISPTERYSTDAATTAAVTASETRIIPYRHDFLVGNLATSSNYATQNGKALRTKITSLKVTMSNGTSFTDPMGWLGQMDGVGTNNVDWYVWNSINKTNPSPFTIGSDTTITLQGLAADNNNIQIGIDGNAIITAVTYDTSKSTFTWTAGIASSTTSGTYDLVVDMVDDTYREEPTLLTINEGRYANTSSRWNYDDERHIFTFKNVRFDDIRSEPEQYNKFILGFFATELTLDI